MLMIDLEIIKNSDGNESLSTVMNKLYTDFALKNKGYSENDFITICEFYGGKEITKIFKDHVYGTENYLPTLKEKLNHVGLKLDKKDNPSISAKYFGLFCFKQDNKIIVKKVEPNSEADKMGIAPEDEILKINGKAISNTFNETLKNCDEEILITLKKKFSEKKIKLKVGNYFILKEINFQNNRNGEQIRNFNSWLA